MVKIIEPKIETAELKSDGTYGKFVAEPLDRGFGTTLGNSLRRVLLRARWSTSASLTALSMVTSSIVSLRESGSPRPARLS